jgi:hypothetical protein
MKRGVHPIELPLSTHGSTQFQAMWQQGYAPVGVVVNLTQSDPNTYLGER